MNLLTIYNRRLARTLALPTSALLLAAAAAQEVTQTITLQPGWNPVYLEVQPANNNASAVLSNLPVASVWTRTERVSSADFIQDPSEQAFNEAGWLGWFHPSRPESFLSSLAAIQANRAYLIKSTSATPVTWAITGRPSLRRLAWAPDAFNLRGFPIDDGNRPSFLNFFRYSPAHFNASSGQLEKIYRLNGSAQWVQVSPNDPMKTGEAYWVYTRGASDYAGPAASRIDAGDGLDFGVELTELTVKLANAGANPVQMIIWNTEPIGQSSLAASTFGINNTASGGPRLAYYTFDAVRGGRWEPLSVLPVSVPAGQEVSVRVAVRRQEVTGTNYSTTLEIYGDAGTRNVIPVTAEKRPPPAGGSPLAGLWQGTARLTGVSEVNSANPTNPTPTHSDFNLRLLIHVNAAGQARLLHEVVQMWRDGTFTNDATGARGLKNPGEYVLLTDDALIPLFHGSAVRDGESVGRRLSSIGYDFPSTHTNNFLNLAGTFAVGQRLTGTLTMPLDHATNPFKHKYHPDHDNLNVRFDGPAAEAYAFTREIELKFQGTPAPTQVVADFGYNEMAGAYSEVITGIHKRPMYVSGTFQLNRVSQISELNPSPTP